MRLLPFLLLGTIVGAVSASDKPLVNLKVEGADAAKLAAFMKDGGIPKEPFAGIPNDRTEEGHPKYLLETEMAYRAETIACQEKKCDPFKLDAKKAKELYGLLKRLGVEELKAPKQKPLFFVKEMVCAAAPEKPTEKAPAVACYVSAHFAAKPKKK